MATAQKHLLDLCAVDLMNSEVVAIPQSMSLSGAARLMSHFSISGAPVIDAHGRCVGVLSKADFLSRAVGDPPPSYGRERERGCIHSAWQMIDPDELPCDEVRRYMTPDPVIAAPGTPVGQLARMMIDAHIHRLVIADDEGRPVGIVSSTDIMAAVAHEASIMARA
jgi:CBS domain-containing protein